MARALWKGSISFSLVNIPVQMHTATRSSTIDLDMLDKRDFSPIGYTRVNKATGKAVEWENIVKGYQHQKGEYVVLTEEDFRRANVDATQTIDIQAFVDRSAIAPYYFDTPYYLTADRQGGKVYALLRDSLEKSDKVAVATVVIRTRQHLAVLLPIGNLIVLNTLRYANEVLAPEKVLSENTKSDKRGGKAARSAAATPKEVQMALKLIDEMTDSWKPDRYHDTYRDDLMKRIEAKVEAGETHDLTAPEKQSRKRDADGKVVDLMGLLRESLKETQRTPAAAATPKKRSSYGRRRASRTRSPRTAARRA